MNADQVAAMVAAATNLATATANQNQTNTALAASITNQGNTVAAAITNQGQINANLAAALAQQNQIMTDLQAAITGLTTATTAATTAAGGAGGAGGAATYHRGPLGALATGPINYAVKEARKHHETATKKLLDTQFNVEPEMFSAFMHKVDARAKNLGFTAANGIGMVPLDPTVNNSPRINIFEDYGSRTMEQIRAYETTFIAANGRESQDSKLLYDLLMNSISSAGLARISVWKDQYSITVTVAGTPTPFEAGLCLLKVIVRESYLDSTATVSYLRTSLSSLDKYIEKNGSDIIDFNSHVMKCISGLSARQETTQDLLVNLFKGYKACKDAKFINYITTIENSHEDGTSPIGHMELMDRVAKYYKKRLATGDDTWEGVDEKEEKIMALETKVSALQKKNARNTTKPTTPTKKASDKPSWLTKHIPPNTPKSTKEWRGYTYYWCHKDSGGKCKGAWRAHKPEDCKGMSGKKRPSPKDTGNAKKSRVDRADESRRIIAAQEANLLAIENESSEESESDANGNDQQE